MPKYQASITESLTWLVEFEAPPNLSTEALERLAIDMCFDPDTSGPHTSRRLVSDGDSHVDFLEEIK